MSGMSLPSAGDLLKNQLRHALLDQRQVLEELTEDEYFWEPASPCWSVRRRNPSVRGWGSGDFVCEDAWPPPSPLPTTTIAWRVVHLAAWTDLYRQFAFTNTGQTSTTPTCRATSTPLSHGCIGRRTTSSQPSPRSATNRCSNHGPPTGENLYQSPDLSPPC